MIGFLLFVIAIGVLAIAGKMYPREFKAAFLFGIVVSWVAASYACYYVLYPDGGPYG